MIKLYENKYLVFNAERVIITYSKSAVEDHSYFFHYYKNDNEYSNEYIKENLDRSLSLRDKFSALKISLSRVVPHEIVFAGKIWKPLYPNDNKTIWHDLEKTIISCLKEGSASGPWHIGNFINVKCPKNEVQDIISKLELYESKLKSKDEEKLI